MAGVQLHQQSSPTMRHMDEPTQERLRDLEVAAAPVQTLRRTGFRPYAFNGNLLATICGVTPALPFWYEFNVFETVLKTYVCDVRLFNKDPAYADIFRVSEQDDLETALGFYERYDPSADLPSSGELLEPGLSSAELALRTARLQLRVNRITEHFRALAGELLAAMQPK